MISKERLKEFEEYIKRYIIFKFQKSLPESSVILLRNTEFVDEKDYKDEKDLNVAQSNLLRKIVHSIINISCELNVKISDSESKKVIYGEHLENGLVEFFSNLVSKDSDFNFIIDANLKEDLEMALEVYKALQDKLEYMTFNYNAIEILEATGLDELIDKNDDLAISEYIESITENVSVANDVKAGTPDIEEIKEEISKEGTFRIVYVNGKRDVQYIDSENKTHIIEVTKDTDISRILRDEITSKTKAHQKFNTYDLYLALKEKFGEVALDNKLDERTTTAEKVSKVDFVNVSEEARNENVTFDSDAGAFVLNETNKVISAKMNEDTVEATLTDANTNDSELKGDLINPVEEVTKFTETKPSADEIEQIYDKASNETLATESELMELKEAFVEDAKNNSTSDIVDNVTKDVNKEELKEINNDLQDNKNVKELNDTEEDEENDELLPKETGKVLSLFGKKKKAAYVDVYVLFFILSLILSLSLIIGVILVYFNN